jgi:phosphoribosyl 1,2-cyclic phosphodiesterase
MATLDLSPESLDAVIISHGHSDHVIGVPVLCRRLRIPAYFNEATGLESSLQVALPDGLSRNFVTGESFSIGDIDIRPFHVPHDCSEPVGFVISDGSVKVCYATDLGSITLDVVHSFCGCDAVVLESHLSNDDAAELLQGIAHQGLKHLFLAHLSQKNNLPELSLQAAVTALGSRYAGVDVSLGWQDKAGELITLG